MINEAQYTSAHVMAEKIDDQFESELDIIFVAGETQKKGPVKILGELLRIYGAEQLGEWPIPDSEWNPESNYPTDKYERKVAGKEKPLKGSWYNDLFNETRMGRHYDGAVKAIQSARADKMDEVPKEFEQYKRLTKAELSAEESRWRNRQTMGRNLIKKAMKVHFQMLHIQEQLPKVSVSFLVDDDGNIKSTPTPIVVANASQLAEAKAVSVGTFLGYDVEAAKADGGTVKDLWATAGGSSKDDTNGDEEHNFHITVKTFDSLMGELATFFEAGKGVNLVSLRTEMSKWDDHSILSFGDAIAELNSIYTSDAFQKRYVPLASGEKEQEREKVSA